MKLIIGFGGRNIKRMTDEAEAFTAVAKGSPALEYYFIADEPHIEKAGDLHDCIARYEALDPAHPCYVNLLGAGWDPETRDDRRRTRGNTGCDTYGEYLESLFKTAPLKMISFDVYPVCAAKPLGNAEHRLHGARAILNDAPGVKVVDDPLNNVYPMPLDATDKYDVLAGRIRQDISRTDKKGLDMFVSGDQLLRGAALNAVEIAECLVARGLV